MDGIVADRRADAWLALLRPANVATSLADVLAGASVAGVMLVASPLPPAALGWLLAATAGLYAGGIVLNDVFDRAVDAVERPERPIPSGRVDARAAAAVGSLLLAGGISAAAVASTTAAVVATATALAVVAYDSWAKRFAVLGPITMGSCRGLNLLLGVSVAPSTLTWAWPLALVPLVYVASVTAISRGEVHGGSPRVLRLALALVGAVLVALAGVVLLSGNASRLHAAARSDVVLHAGWALALLVWLAWRVLPAFARAAATADPADIRRAVRTGVLSLVLVDAVLAAAYAGIMNSLAVLATGLLAWWLSRLFAVT